MQGPGVNMKADPSLTQKFYYRSTTLVADRALLHGRLP